MIFQFCKTRVNVVIIIRFEFIPDQNDNHNNYIDAASALFVMFDILGTSFLVR